MKCYSSVLARTTIDRVKCARTLQEVQRGFPLSYRETTCRFLQEGGEHIAGCLEDIIRRVAFQACGLRRADPRGSKGLGAAAVTLPWALRGPYTLRTSAHHRSCGRWDQRPGDVCHDRNLQQNDASVGKYTVGLVLASRACARLVCEGILSTWVE